MSITVYDKNGQPYEADLVEGEKYRELLGMLQFLSDERLIPEVVSSRYELRPDDYGIISLEKIRKAYHDWLVCPECGGSGSVTTETRARYGDPSHRCPRCAGTGRLA